MHTYTHIQIVSIVRACKMRQMSQVPTTAHNKTHSTQHTTRNAYATRHINPNNHTQTQQKGRGGGRGILWKQKKPWERERHKDKNKQDHKTQTNPTKREEKRKENHKKTEKPFEIETGLGLGRRHPSTNSRTSSCSRALRLLSRLAVYNIQTTKIACVSASAIRARVCETR